MAVFGMMRDSQQDRQFLAQAERALMDAPFATDGWRTGLDHLARATWSRGTNLVCLGSGAPTLNLFTGFDVSEVEDAFRNPELWGPGNWRVGVTSRPFEVQHDEHYTDYRQRVPAGDYDDVTHQLDMPHGCQTIFSQDAAGFIGLAVLRGRRDGPCDPAAVERFERLSRVVGRALRVEMALAGEGIRLALGQYDRVNVPAFVLNRHGWLCGMSAAAERLLTDGRVFRQSGARLSLADPVDERRLAQLLGFLLHSERYPGQAAQMRLRSARMTLLASHLPDRGLALGFDPSLIMIVEPSGTRRVWS